ncbi:MAG: hypothetical protein GYA51_10230 [Candidatus Methanofastidiosa archaeon]|nr:hypothetical protein [Candidatus Methanofastidiosa archaeon]
MSRFRSDDPDWRRFKEAELEHELYWEERELREEEKRKRAERQKKEAEDRKKKSQNS